MKKINILPRCLSTDYLGLSYNKLLTYFYPEFITALIIYSLPFFIDGFFICYLKSTDLYAISGIVENFLTMFIKAAEGLSIATVIVAGYHNGLKQYKEAGRAFADAFWTVVVIGALISMALYFGVSLVYKMNHFTPEMIEQGTPYLQIKAIGVFFMFIYFGFVGFLRSIKNTFVPMVIFGIGSIVFIISDYLLIFGSHGFPQLGLTGSAVAYMLQYIVMSVIMGIYILCTPRYKKYVISLCPTEIDFCRVKKLLLVSIPVLIDKVSIAFAYAWLGMCISQLGTTSKAAFSLVKLMERFAFLPAIAFSQIVTFLVSNDMGKGQWDIIHANIKKIVLLSAIMVGIILLFGSMWPEYIVHLFDHNGEFGHIVATVFSGLSILVLFDLLQLVLSGALRGAGDVRTVMWTRVIIIFGYFIPVTYLIPLLPITDVAYKILVTYGAFLFGNGLMSIMYIIRLCQTNWKKQTIKVCDE